LQDKVLKAVATAQTSFYLTGGTALSRFYFNHRYSDDLDFFVNKDPDFSANFNKIISALSEFKVEIKIKTDDFCSLFVEKILNVDLVNDVAFHYGSFLENEIFYKIDNVENILSNKLSAIISREQAKDVVDIWIIAKDQIIDWKQIYQSVSSKAAGIFPPVVAKKLNAFPGELLNEIKWIGVPPNAEEFNGDLQKIIDSMLLVS
jgi:predicted nucleotidyltransferase component of viral defense system